MGENEFCGCFYVQAKANGGLEVSGFIADQGSYGVLAQTVSAQLYSSPMSNSLG